MKMKAIVKHGAFLVLFAAVLLTCAMTFPASAEAYDFMSARNLTISAAYTGTTHDTGMADWMLLIVVNIIVGSISAVVLILIHRTNESNLKDAQKPELAEAENIVKTGPLFIPLGEEITEEEIIPEEIETLDEVSAEIVDELMTDTLAEALLEESKEMGGIGKMGIINVGIISPEYNAGDVVTLVSLREKGLIDANVGRLKVLASGTLDKPLTIKADAFSFQAIKMITLTGGHAVHLKAKAEK